MRCPPPRAWLCVDMSRLHAVDAICKSRFPRRHHARCDCRDNFGVLSYCRINALMGWSIPSRTRIGTATWEEEFSRREGTLCAKLVLVKGVLSNHQNYPKRAVSYLGDD